MLSFFLSMEFPLQKLTSVSIPRLLQETPEPPDQLYLRGSLPSPELTLLSVVGSRKYTTYGKQAVDDLISGLSGYPIGIVSGLALGMDSLAHEAALRNNIYTMAIPGGGINDEVIYPARHKPLARKILESGGGLMSEYEPDFRATRWSFPKRNRLVAGISHATLLIEAGEKSGTLITARLATDYNRDLMVVPGSIYSSNSHGVHQFLKLGAIPVTESQDILDTFGITQEDQPKIDIPTTLNTDQERVLNLLREPVHKDELIRQMELPISETAQILMMMELDGLIKNEQNIYRRN